MTRWLASGLVLAMMSSHALTFPAQANNQTNLSITIDGLKKAQGQICLNLFSSSQGFPSKGEQAVKSQCINVTGTSETITFENLLPGSYAVAVIHDLNDDGKLNRNLLGIPTEGFGFSNNPVIRTGPPKFRESVIIVTGQKTNIRIQLQHLS
ncbi:conserved hypothetical protein [Gloeothece citriformis PCC 7424]|uniref:DUF2141 domain-containing protein n=1 Tax=Gloeothece citriformis (strain PCC 7424) TaxID=65393 RepID=B7KL25_GLOC7|nr:DUF2141 domain-containing protein [Gloeothece citriformis]ACK72397.1 conserved hypothetical protein [Gloeothece citriformis PCC 7424]